MMFRSPIPLIFLIPLIGACVPVAYGPGERPATKPPPDVDARPRGLWLLPRKDPGNTGRSDVSGDFSSAPVEVWRYGGGAGACRYAREVPADGAPAYLVQRGRGLELVRPDGRAVWRHSTLGVDAVIGVEDFTGRGGVQALVSLGIAGFALLDAASGRTLWSWSLPEATRAVRCQLWRRPEGARLYVFPPGTLSTTGFCFDFAGTDGRPRNLWERDFTGRWWANYGPNLVLADMDGDAVPEVVVASKPAYVGVLDGGTGEVKFELHYEIEDPLGFGRPDGAHIGRPYGLLHAADIDGDGDNDLVLVSTQVEEFIAVLRNEGGGKLTAVWTLFVEKDFPADLRELRAQPTSLADVDGDGRRELVLGLFNVEGDGRWHTLVLDPFGGFRARRADLADHYFWGCFDLDGDGRPEILTSPLRSRWPSDADAIEARDGRTMAVVGAVRGARPVTIESNIARMFPPLRPEWTYYGALAEPWFLPGSEAGTGLAVRLDAQPGREFLWRIAGGRDVREPFAPSTFARARMLSGDEVARTGRRASPGGGGEEDSVAARSPLVAAADGRRELVMSLSDGTVIGGVPDFARTGRFAASWRVRGVMPAVWIGTSGERLVSVADPNADVVRVWKPVAGRNPRAPLREFRLPLPLNRNPAAADFLPRGEGNLVPFGGKAMWLFVPLRQGEHQLGGCLYGPDGGLRWTDREVGPHPRPAAAVDLDGDGAEELVVDNHGMQYHFDRSGRRRLVAHVWGDSVPGRGDGCAHALPMVGPWGPDGALRVVMTPGYTALEVQGPGGERIARRAFAHAYEFLGRTAGIGKVGPEGTWALGMMSDRGVFHCMELSDGRDRWTFDLGLPTSWPVSCATGDLDGDGGDEFLIGLPDGRLVALAEAGGKGALRWEVRFEAGVQDAIPADLDADGRAEIVAETDDGFVRILKGRKP